LSAIETYCTVRDLDGMTTWSPAGSAPGQPARTAPVVDLIQGYDELVMSYFESRRLLAPAGVLPVADWTSYLHAILIDGRLAGYWRHRLGTSSATVDVQLRRPLAADEWTVLVAAVDRYAAYLGVPAIVGERVLLG
jgi:Winged helix DNA-binding domain